MKKVVLASSNKHKMKEFQEMLSDREIVLLEDIGFVDEIEENGETFLDNSLIKARAVMAFLKKKNMEMPVLADDSGLCVDALDGAPGVLSARYAGDGHHADAACREKVLQNMKGQQNRTAHFECAIVELFPDDSYIFGIGKVFGEIADKPYGDLSFCYDPIFKSNELGKTFGEASAEEKNSVSHRSRALQDLRKKEQKKEKTDKSEKGKKTENGKKTKEAKNASLIQILKFTLFSISAGLIELAVSEIMYDLLHINYWVSYVTALVASVIWNFTFNRKFTFKSAKNVPIAMLMVAGYYAVFAPLSTLWGNAMESAGVPGILVTAFSMIVNFVTEFIYQKFVVFRGSINSAVNSDDKRIKDVIKTLNENEKLDK